MIAPLLRVAASGVAARTLRVAAHDVVTRSMMTIGAGVALAVAAFCLTAAAFILLEREMDRAAAFAIMGAVWGLAGLIYFIVAQRRRG